jgi:hypothetical protein
MFLIGVTVVVVVGSMLLIILAYATPTAGYGMMGYPGGHSWVWIFPMALIMILVPLAIVLVLAPLLLRPDESAKGLPPREA